MKNLSKFFIILFCFLGLNILKAQENKTFLLENFDDNRYKWDTITTKKTAMIIGAGSYVMSCKDENQAIISTIPVSLPDTVDFEIEANFTKIAGTDGNGFGLVFGKEGEVNEYNFLISGNGQVNIIDWVGEKIDNVYPWNRKDFVNKYDTVTNKLALRKQKDFLYFYVNDQFAARVKFKKFSKYKVGFAIHQNIDIKIDKLSILKNTRTVIELPKLEIDKFTFVEPSGNRELDDGEQTYLNFSVENKSKLPTGNLKVKIAPTVNTAEAKVMNMDIGSIGANKKRSFSLKMTVIFDTKYCYPDEVFVIEILDDKNNSLISRELKVEISGTRYKINQEGEMVYVEPDDFDDFLFCINSADDCLCASFFVLEIISAFD